MSNKIVLMDQKAASSSLTITPTTFADLKVDERKNLEEWIKENPDILGTKLLLITSEFDRFDKSEKRLDLLALDDKGKLVIIELKRDAAGSHADLQAIRYAAFCSTMRFEEMVNLYAHFAKKGGIEEARQDILGFVGDPGFSELDNKPRIILAAGGFDDPEITSCVLWLRKCGIDISCVEITPYRMPDNRIVLAPRVIIPLPEAEDYMVRVEEKEAQQGQQRTVTESDLLKAADVRGVAPLLDLCPKVKTVWKENVGSAYGGSFVYSLTTENGWRSLFGVNVSGDRKATPVGQLDVWIPIKNLAEVAKQEESVIRTAVREVHFQLVAEEKLDTVIRLSKTDDAQALVNLLLEWASSGSQLPPTDLDQNSVHV
jgi:hypothetical protein